MHFCRSTTVFSLELKNKYTTKKLVCSLVLSPVGLHEILSIKEVTHVRKMFLGFGFS